MGDVWWIVKSGDVDDLRDYVEKNKIDVNVTNETGRNLAHVAADYNFVDILKYLKEKGAKLDVCPSLRTLFSLISFFNTFFFFLLTSHRTRTSTASPPSSVPSGRVMPDLWSSSSALELVKKSFSSSLVPLASWLILFVSQQPRSQGQDPRGQELPGGC